jgi:hypothetical protein
VLQISVPKVQAKSKQCQRKRSKSGNQVIDGPLLPPQLGLLCPTRTLGFCMAATWWCRRAVTARLLTVRKAGSTGRAAAKRDAQGVVPAGAWKVSSSRDLASHASARTCCSNAPAAQTAAAAAAAATVRQQTTQMRATVELTRAAAAAAALHSTGLAVSHKAPPGRISQGPAATACPHWPGPARFTTDNQWLLA